MQTLATPCLYRDMEISGEFLCDRFLGMLTSHPGLTSIRTLRIVRPYSQKPGFLCRQELSDAICCLLSAIP
jgi:hypothetical protein